MQKIMALALAPLLFISAQGFGYDGNDLQKWSRSFEAMQKGADPDWKSSMFVGYVAGVTDTIHGIVVCPQGNPTHLQNAAIVSKYISQNPEKWTEDGAVIVATALQLAYPPCKKN